MCRLRLAGILYETIKINCEGLYVRVRPTFQRIGTSSYETELDSMGWIPRTINAPDVFKNLNLNTSNILN